MIEFREHDDIVSTSPVTRAQNGLDPAIELGYRTFSLFAEPSMRDASLASAAFGAAGRSAAESPRR
jgi:hypothetical protein